MPSDCRQMGLEVVRNYVGNYCPSLEMQGFSLTLLKLDDRLEKLLDDAEDRRAVCRRDTEAVAFGEARCAAALRGRAGLATIESARGLRPRALRTKPEAGL